MTPRRLERAAVRKQLGEPSEQTGSVNEPRIEEEQGHRWNEKWLYRVRGGPRNGRPERVILWHRYDFVGVFRVGDDGRLAAETLPGLSAQEAREREPGT